MKIKNFQVVEGWEGYKRNGTDTITTTLYTKASKFFENHRFQFFDHYGRCAKFVNDGGSITVDWSSSKETKNYRIFENDYLCHNPVNESWCWGLSTGLLNIHGRFMRPETQVPFFEWLFDPKTSPWRLGLQGTTVITEECKLSKGKKFTVPVAWLLRDTSNLNFHHYVNLLIATRLMTSWASDYMWFRMLELGFTREEALIIAVNWTFNSCTLTITGNPRDSFKPEPTETLPLGLVGPAHTDTPFIMRDASKFSAARFISGEPLDIESSWSNKNPSPNPCNWIWAQSPVYGNNQANFNDVSKEAMKLLNKNYVESVTPKAKSMRITRNFVRDGSNAKDVFGLYDYVMKGTKPSSEKIALLKEIFRTDAFFGWNTPEHHSLTAE